MNQMNHSLVSKCITRSFGKSQVFLETKRYANVSSSRIRFSVITELIMLGEDTLDNIAHCFAKHSKETFKKFYVNFSSKREAARLSWKSLQMFTLIKEEEKVEAKCTNPNFLKVPPQQLKRLNLGTTISKMH